MQLHLVNEGVCFRKGEVNMKWVLFGVGLMVTGSIMYSGVIIRDALIVTAPNFYLSGTDALHYVAPAAIICGAIVAFANCRNKK